MTCQPGLHVNEGCCLVGEGLTNVTTTPEFDPLGIVKGTCQSHTIQDGRVTNKDIVESLAKVMYIYDPRRTILQI